MASWWYRFYKGVASDLYLRSWPNLEATLGQAASATSHVPCMSNNTASLLTSILLKFGFFHHGRLCYMVPGAWAHRGHCGCSQRQWDYITQECQFTNCCPNSKTFEVLASGQALLLQQGIESLTKPKDVDTSTAPLVNAAKTDAETAPQEESLDASTLLLLLQKDPSDNQAAATGKHPHTHTFDPFNCNVASPGKLYDLRDFITVMPEFREKSTALKVGDIELTLPTRRPKLESITPFNIWRVACP